MTHCQLLKELEVEVEVEVVSGIAIKKDELACI